MSCSAGQTRSRVTGRCRKPCERHQAINPATGRCVSKNYLRKIQRESCGPNDSVYNLAPYGVGSKKDLRDGLVPDALCYPRMRNIHTGYCKTPCGQGRAINPATGNCVTLRYLRMLHPNDYDTDDDDEMAAHILFTPTTILKGAQYENDVSKLAGFKVNMLTENDLTVMRAAFEMGTVGGVYSPDERKDTCKTSQSEFNTTMFSPCGLSQVGNLTPDYKLDNKQAPIVQRRLEDVVMANTDLAKNIFTFVTVRDARTIPNDLLDKCVSIASSAPVRILICNFYGVWRLLIPKVSAEAKENLVTSARLVTDAMRKYEGVYGDIDSRKLANEVHEAVKARNDLHLSFAPYPGV